MKRRVIAAALLSALLVCCAAVFAGCAAKPSEGLRFRAHEEGGTCAVVGVGTCEDRTVRVPECSPSGELVTEIADFAFFGNETLEEVILPDGVAVVGASAFADCTALRSVTFGQGVKEIGEMAFSGCTSLARITSRGREEASHMQLSLKTGDALRPYSYRVDLLRLPSGLTSIGDAAFRGCRALSGILVLDEEGLSVGSCAFEKCALTYVYVGASVAAVGRNAFYDMNFRCIVAGVREGAVPEAWAEGWNKKTASAFHDMLWGLPFDSEVGASFRYVLELLMSP